MRLVIQRVQRAQVVVQDRTVGQIGPGALVLLGVHKNDTEAMVRPLVDKLIVLRFFQDDEGKMNRSLVDTGGELLIVSQFTLYADCQSGRRPSFTEAAPGELARKLYEQFVREAKSKLTKVETGEFGAYMQVSLVNDGPVTLILEDQ